MVGVVVCTIMLGGVYWFVVVDYGEEIGIENIHKILGKESHVFYNDGETKLGVFFDNAHRQYVKFDDIPNYFVNALVASEDDRFFDHFGFDVFGIGRAMIKNIQAGRVVQGGSTLTQQTAKNLFKRSGRSYREKLKELLFALRLEYHYSKNRIFEFYSNQFYVSGNGHGLGVAARYYFDKQPEELSLLESAFIAGSVKRPNYYNPFIKKTDKGAEQARIRAKERVGYVLKKMFNLSMIDSYLYHETLSQEIIFNKGKVGFALDYGMELVRDAVSSTAIVEALAKHGVSNIATSGVRIITTLDKNLQKRALTTMRSELSRLDVRLRGYTRDEIQTELANLTYNGDDSLEEGAFVFGQVEAVSASGEEPKLHVLFDRNLGRGIVDSVGLAKIVQAKVKYEKNRWSEMGKDDYPDLLQEIVPGDRLWVRIREIAEDKTVKLNLEKFPQLQGAAIILKDGTLKAMAGGVENRFFNRAIYARRPMGSAFKIPVFAAAVQLGWSGADTLNNYRQVFVYQNQPYFPRPDHVSPYDQVSMNWAGVHSENIASVWLLTHLCDKLTASQFKNIAEHVGLTPRVVDGQKEPYRLYRSRIRDRFGVQVDRQALRAVAYKQAVENLETDFIFDGLLDEYQYVKRLPYGLDFKAYRQIIEDKIVSKEKTLKKHERKELELRSDLLASNYLQLEVLNTQLFQYRKYIEDGEEIVADLYDDQDLPAALYYSSDIDVYSFQSEDSDLAGLIKVDSFDLVTLLQALTNEERKFFWQSVRLDGSSSVRAFEKIVAQLDHEETKLLSSLPYSFEVLSKVDDFRIAVGLLYLIQFSKELGIQSALEPVLSFPLGSNVVTLLEATRMYEGLVTGKVTTFGSEGLDENNEALAIIDRIESSTGEVFYRPEPVSTILVDDKTRIEVGSILENIVKFGTGRRADKNIRLVNKADKADNNFSELNLAMPVLGKTGTANRYTNASFFGYLPGVDKNGVSLSIDEGFAVGVYVGYDKNQPMRRRTSRISGSAGALPGWSSLVNTLLVEEGYYDKLDAVDLSFYGLGIKWATLGQKNLSVDPNQGGQIVEPVALVSEGARYQPAIRTFGMTTEAGRFKPERQFKPYWQVSQEAVD